MDRRAFTLVELLVIIAIIGILAVMICGGVGGCNSGYYKQSQTGVYQCVKTYTVAAGKNKSTKRVDLRSANGSIETMCVDDDAWAGQYNSATIYAQFEQGKWFSVSSIGFRREGVFALFPLVTSASQVPDPKAEQER